MLTPLLNNCTDCGSLDSAICELDGTIAWFGKNAYQNLAYLTNKPTDACDMLRLSIYRNILIELKNNSGYYNCYNMQDIVSRARALVAGYPKIAKRVTV